MTDNNMNERMTRVETKMENIELQVTNHIPTSIKDLKISIFKKFDDVKTSNNLYLDNKVNSHTRDVLDNKYASKLTQKIVYGIATAVGLGFIGSVITLILK